MFCLLISSMRFLENFQACEELDLSPTDVEPDRVVPQSLVTLSLEIRDVGALRYVVLRCNYA